jgi:hypothetical protein
VSECSQGVMYQVWGDIGVVPSQFRVSYYALEDHYDALSRGKRGFEDFRVVCCACHLASDYHLHRQAFRDGACHRCRSAVEGGFQNIRHHARVMRMLMR